MNDELLELLAEGSHIGWMQEKQRQGYADHALMGCWTEQMTTTGICMHPAGPSGCHSNYCRIPADKHHTDMLLYADLPEHIKEYDRVTVRGVLAGIERHGYRIVRANA